MHLISGPISFLFVEGLTFTDEKESKFVKIMAKIRSMPSCHNLVPSFHNLVSMPFKGYAEIYSIPF